MSQCTSLTTHFHRPAGSLKHFKHVSVLQEAVAIQLEEERLVKIKDVLKELPALHYKYSPFRH